MKHINSTLLLSLLASLPLIADASIVKGTLMDPELKEAEPFATIRIYKGQPEGKALFTVLSDVDGNFSQEINKPGKYTFVFSSVGKEDLIREVVVDKDKDLDLGTLDMKTDATVMDELVVVAQKPLVKMTADQMTYNVAEDTDSKTQTLLDMLRKVPMVTVDGEDNITVNGSSSFQIYVDGKPSLLFSGNPSQMFKAMPASAVKQIEVVTNPGARYDAEGAGGVLNLILDRQSAGANALDKAYNASVGLRGGNRGYGGNIYTNFKTGRLTTSLNAIYNKATPGETSIDTKRVQGNEVVTSRTTGKTRLPFTMGNLSLEYEIDSLTTIGGSFALNGFGLKAPAYSETSFSGTGADFGYTNLTDMKTDRTGITGSVDFSHFFDGSQHNHLTATYQIQSEHNTNKTNSTFDAPEESFINLTDRISDNKEQTTVHMLQTDFISRLNEKNTLSVGAKATLRSASSDAKYYLEDIFDADGSSNYDNHNTIAAVYGEYAFSSEKASAKGGLRYEHTWQDVKYHSGHGSDFKTDYGILVPSASLSYTLSSSSNIGLNYNMRISRPGITYLNPYVDRSNPTSISYGNPDLDVEKSHYMALVYNKFSSKFMMNLTLSHSYTGNGIEQYSFMDNNIMNTTYGNIVKRNKTELNAFVNWMPYSKTRIFLNGSVGYTDLKSSSLDLHNSGWQGSATFGVQQTLPLDFKLGAFLIASSKTRNLQGWSSGFQMVTLNLSKGFLNNDLNVSIGAMAGLSGGGNLKMESFSAYNNFSNLSTIKVPMAGITVGVTYTFGNSKNISRKNTRTVEDDYIEHSSEMNQLAQPEMNGAM